MLQRTDIGDVRRVIRSAMTASRCILGVAVLALLAVCADAEVPPAASQMHSPEAAGGAGSMGTFWSRYRLEFGIAAFLVIAESVLIGLLLYERRARRRSMRAVRESEAVSSAVLASMSSNIAILDRGGRIVRVNDAWQRFAAVGTVGDNYVGACRVAADAGDEIAAALLPRLEQVLSVGGEGFSVERTGVGSGPEDDWFELRVEPLAIAEGGAVLTYTDITARKRAEREAVSQMQVLAHVSRAITLGALSGSLAHELNQPLTAILSNAQVAAKLLSREPLPDDEIAEILNDIVSDTKRASEVIRRLRALLREGETEHAMLDINDVVSNTVRLVADDIIIRKVRLNVELESDLPPITGDAVQLQQVILNLIMNAMDALEQMPATDRALSVATGMSDELLTIRVEDAGPGAPAELRARMFDPFVTTKASGLGLGLYINRAIITAHGGDITALPNTAGGLTMQVTLPCLAEAVGRVGPWDTTTSEIAAD